jgi:hypothetical protein
MILRALLVLSALGLFACDDDIAFYIFQNQVPSDGCFITAEDTIHRPEGTLDISLGRGYVLFPLLRNDMPARKLAGDISDRADPHALHLREYEVKLEFVGVQPIDDPSQLQFTEPTSGMLLPGGKRASKVAVIPDDVARKIKLTPGVEAMALAEVTAIADSEEGRVVSQPFFYSIHLCSGCLVATLSQCSDAIAGVQSNVCGLPQDEPLICCNHDELGLICPSPATAQ